VEDFIVRHWIQSVKDRWKTTSPKRGTEYFDYKKSIRERQDREREYLEKWKKDIRARMNINSKITAVNSQLTYAYPTSIENITIADDTAKKVTIDGTIEVQGRDILKELDEMRDALLLLKRDVNMEEKYPKLRELKDAYESQLEKYKTFEALK